MSRYGKVYEEMWTDAKFRALSAPEPCGQFLWVWLLTGPCRTAISGVVIGKPAVLAGWLDWNPVTFERPMRELEDSGLVQFDRDAGLVWLPKALRYGPPANPNTVKMWGKFWRRVPECPLKDVIYQALMDHCEQRGEPFREPFGEWFMEPLAEPLPKPVSVSVSVSEAVAASAATATAGVVVPRDLPTKLLKRFASYVQNSRGVPWVAPETEAREIQAMIKAGVSSDHLEAVWRYYVDTRKDPGKIAIHWFCKDFNKLQAGLAAEGGA